MELVVSDRNFPAAKAMADGASFARALARAVVGRAADVRDLSSFSAMFCMVHGQESS